MEPEPKDSEKKAKPKAFKREDPLKASGLKRNMKVKPSQAPGKVNPRTIRHSIRTKSVGIKSLEILSMPFFYPKENHAGCECQKCQLHENCPRTVRDETVKVSPERRGIGN